VGAKDADEGEPIDVGGEEEIDEDSLEGDSDE
jgi:hypothetical protein